MISDFSAEDLSLTIIATVNDLFGEARTLSQSTSTTTTKHNLKHKQTKKTNQKQKQQHKRNTTPKAFFLFLVCAVTKLQNPGSDKHLNHKLNQTIELISQKTILERFHKKTRKTKQQESQVLDLTISPNS
jgi:hypothetical protein